MRYEMNIILKQTKKEELAYLGLMLDWHRNWKVLQYGKSRLANTTLRKEGRINDNGF
jgi:hypothetical protein